LNTASIRACVLLVSPSGDHQGTAGMHVQAMHQRGGVRDNTSGDRGIRRRGSLHDVGALQTSLRLAIRWARECDLEKSRAPYWKTPISIPHYISWKLIKRLS